MMILGLLANWMVGSALWARWGHGSTAFYPSAAIAAAGSGALFTLGVLLDGGVDLTRRHILGTWALWSWLCLCFRFSDRLGTENASWPYYLCFLVPAVLTFRNRHGRRWSAWVPRSIAEMRADPSVQEPAESREPKFP